jgi:nicotinamidase-related amidase
MNKGARKDLLHTKPSDQSNTVLLIVDVINPFEFDGWEDLVGRAQAIAAPLSELKQRAREAKVPVIYVNDNFGQWRSNSESLVKYGRTRGNARELVEALAPESDDYFVLKPMHSGFYETPLSLLLRALGARKLVLAGLWTNSCVLFTAHDAYMRDFCLSIPADCVAACSDEDQQYALDQMRTILKADISSAANVLFTNEKQPDTRRTMPKKKQKKSENAMSMLKDDHKKVKELFDKFEDATSPAAKHKIVKEALGELKVHAAVEEEFFYPALRQEMNDEEGLMDEADEEHHVAKVLIAELEAMQGDEDHWEAKFKVLAENIRHHIKEEEGEIFPEARKTDVDFVALGGTMAEMKSRLMRDGVPPDAEARMVAKSGLRGDSPAKKALQKLEVPIKAA